MKKNIKAISFIIAVIMMALPLFSCHGTAGTEKKTAEKSFSLPESFDETKNYEISFWAKNDTNKNQVAVYDKAVEDFSKIYPNIKVNIRYYTDYQKIYQDVITNIPTKTTPNVCISYPDHIATYITGDGVVVPLNEIVSNEKYGLGGKDVKFDSPKKEDIVPEFLKEGYIGDTLYAIPFMRSTEALYINKTYVEKLGYKVPENITWDYIWEVSEKATEKDKNGKFKVNGQDVMIPFIYKSTDNMMIQITRQKNGEYADENGNIKIFNDTTKNILFEIASHVKSGAFSTFKTTGYPANFLNAGQCIFAIDSTAGSTWMGSKAPLSDIGEERTVEFETEVRAIPQIDTENPKMISQGPSICIFGKDDSQEVLASWLFTQFLITNDVQISYSETEGYVPVTKKAQESEEYKEYLSKEGTDNDVHYDVKIRAVKMLMANQANTFTTPVFNGSASLREASGDMIEKVTKSVKRNETVDDAYIEALFKDIPVRFHLNQAKNAG